MSRAPAPWFEILDLLVDGPSSFAALYSAWCQHYATSASRPSVGELWEVTSGLEIAGWIRSSLMHPDRTWTSPSDQERRSVRRQYERWLPEAPFEDMSVDEVGMWFEIQPIGRGEWQKWAGTEQRGPRWVLDLDAEAAAITVRGEDLETAEKALREWLDQAPTIELVADSRVIEPCRGFRLRDGTFVPDGIKLVYRYRETK